MELFQVYSMLQKVIPEVEKKKTKDMTADEKYSHLSNWSYLRPNMSYDFAVDHAVYAPSICKFESIGIKFGALALHISNKQTLSMDDR